MAYTRVNFKTKKALKEAVAKGEQIDVFEPGVKTNPGPPDGTVFLEGPHYPEAHKWYATAVVRNGIIQSLK